MSKIDRSTEPLVMEARKCFAGPEPVQGVVKEVDATQFVRAIPLRALRIPAKSCNVFMAKFKYVALNIPRFRNIISDPAAKEGEKCTTRVVLLCPSIKTLSDLSEEQQELVKSQSAKLIDHEIKLGFDYWSAEQILRAAIPPEIDEITSSFETIGHLAHMNLRTSQLPYKHIFGEVILRKNRGLRSVVNKLTEIENTYRNFKMELIAGEDDFQTTVKESGCIFKMEYNKVYWNSRLHHEHDRIIKKLTEGDVVYDMFGGIGPFALPAAKKKCVVYCNDLNPDSYKALCVNMKVNKVEKFIKPYNMDGRDFMRKMVKLSQSSDASSKVPDAKHVIMNLPASAHLFLDVFRGLYVERKDTMCVDDLPMIHCYCFSSAEDLVADAKKMCEEVMDGEIIEPFAVHEVRDVAPKKRMMCVSFRLSPAIAFAPPPAAVPSTATHTIEASTDDARKPKKQKLDNE